MAAPITHIVFSEKLFNKFKLTHDKKTFMVGTSFPDIRYLGVINRETTHLKVSSLEEILKDSNAFTAGLKFHNWLDLIREDYIKTNNIYDMVKSDSKYVTQALKLLEDQIFYRKISDWNEIQNYFNETQPEELSFGINETDIKKWHQALQNYYATEPNLKSLSKFANTINLPINADKEIYALLERWKSDQKLMTLVESMYDNLTIDGASNTN